MRYWVGRIAVLVVVVGGFLALWLSTWLENTVMVWAVYALWALVAVGAAVGSIRRPRSTTRSSENPGQLDPNVINEVYLGRTQATFAESSSNLSAQIVEPPPLDPLRLPDRPDDPR